MSEEEIKEEAKRIISWEWESVKRFNESEQFFLRESEEGEIEFCINIEKGDLGRGEIFYSPQPFIEKLIKDREEELEFAKDDPPAALEIHRWYLNLRINETASILIRNIEGDLGLAIAEQGVRALSAFYEGTKNIPSSQEYLVSSKNELMEFSNQRKERIKSFVKELQKRDVMPQVLFCYIYEKQKELWTEVKACYKKNIGYKNCLAMVKAQFPNLPNDLVEMLADPDPYASKPSTLALYGAAKISNVPENLSSQRALQDYLKESRNLMKTASVEDIFLAFLLCYFINFRDQRLRDLIKALSADPEAPSTKIH